MLMRCYPTILILHSYWRWVVLLSALTTLGIAAWRWQRRLSFRPLGQQASIFHVAVLDFQLLLGLCLYSVSPYVRIAWRNLAAAMKQHEPRFFGVEHVTTMLLALAVAHLGLWRCQRARSDRAGYLNLLGWYGASLALILAGLPWWRPFLRILSAT